MKPQLGIASTGNRSAMVRRVRSSPPVSELVRGRLGSRRGDRGATALEYALMAGLIACVIVAAVTIFGRNVIGLFDVPSSIFNR